MIFNIFKEYIYDRLSETSSHSKVNYCQATVRHEQSRAGANRKPHEGRRYNQAVITWYLFEVLKAS